MPRLYPQSVYILNESTLIEIISNARIIKIIHLQFQQPHFVR